MRPEKIDDQEYSYTGTRRQTFLEAEKLIHQMHQLLLCKKSPLHSESKLCNEVALLKYWLDDWHNGESLQKVSVRGAKLIDDIKGRLKLAVEEIQRLEGEGGNPATKSQEAEMESLNKASSKLEELIPILEENIFQPKHAAHPTH